MTERDQHCIGQVIGMAPDPNKYWHSNRLVDNDTAIGIEFELETFDNYQNLPHGLKFWLKKHDGSLRMGGIEFVSGSLSQGVQVPLTGDNIVRALSEIQSLFDLNKKHGYEPTLSKRTSVHIHMDVRDLTFIELCRLVMIYMTFEKTLFRFCGKGRDKNAFCIPFRQNRRLRESLLSLTNKDVTCLTDIATKYDAVNLNSIMVRGSVEFRMHEGCVDTNKILAWINILLSLKVAAKRLDLKPKQVTSYYSQQGYHGFVYSIFNKELFDTWLAYDGIEADLVEGMRYAQDMEFIDKFLETEKEVNSKPCVRTISQKEHIINAYLEKQGECLTELAISQFSKSVPKKSKTSTVKSTSVDL